MVRWYWCSIRGRGKTSAFAPSALRNSLQNLASRSPEDCSLTYTHSTLNVLKSRRERGQNPYRGLLGLVPAAWMWTLVPIYLYLRPHILRYHLLPFAFYIGLVNAYSVGQIIVAHLTKSRFAYQNVLLLPLVFGVADSIGTELPRLTALIPAWTGLQSTWIHDLGWPSALGPSYQVPFVFASLGLSLGVYGSFVVDVITSICDYLDIWCLTIKHPHVKPSPSKQNGAASEKRHAGRPRKEK